MYVRTVKTASGATAVQVATKVYGKVVSIKHVGSAHNELELSLLMETARDIVIGGQTTLLPAQAKPAIKARVRQSSSKLLLDVLSKQYADLGFDSIDDHVFKYLCLARIVEPTSKLDSLRVLEDLGVTGITKNPLYDCLKRVVANKYQAKVAEQCLNAVTARAGDLSFVLYDVTTLYFETDQADDFRKPGLSKERRLEPQIVVGLLVDTNGFPLALHSFEGNQAETTTILPVIQEFKRSHKLTNITVVADAGMTRNINLQQLRDMGFSYIVGARFNKVPAVVARAQATASLKDKQILIEQVDPNSYIYQYTDKRAKLDLRNIDKQVEKANKIITGTTHAKHAKFLTVTTNKKTLNETLVTKARALAGVKGYITNLDLPADEIIGYYRQLWNVEASFRMTKSDLRARPIFHYKKDSIKAHLTIVFTALAISRTIENKTSISIRSLVQKLKPIRTATIALGDKTFSLEPEIPVSVKEILDSLRSVH